MGQSAWCLVGVVLLLICLHGAQAHQPLSWKPRPKVRQKFDAGSSSTSSSTMVVGGGHPDSTTQHWLLAKLCMLLIVRIAIQDTVCISMCCVTRPCQQRASVHSNCYHRAGLQHHVWHQTLNEQQPSVVLHPTHFVCIIPLYIVQ